jgi:hypothetical protein
MSPEPRGFSPGDYLPGLKPGRSARYTYLERALEPMVNNPW